MDKQKAEPIGDMANWLPGAIGGLEHTVYALLEGYPATCFAKATVDNLALPPAFVSLSRGPHRLDWSLFWDLRIFDGKNEWHAWRDSRGEWRGRRLAAAEIEDSFDRKFALWGSREKERSDHWVLITEDRGTELWLPEEKVVETGLPLFLKTKLVVDYDAAGIAGIVDMMIVGFVGEK